MPNSLHSLLQAEPVQKPPPQPLDDVQKLPEARRSDVELSRAQVHPFDTIVLDFKQESSFVVKLDPARPIHLQQQSINPNGLIALYDGATVQLDPFCAIRDAFSEEYFTSKEFWQAKNERKQRQKSAATARVNIASAFLLCQRRFAQSTTKDFFLLNPASLAFLLDFAAPADIKTRSHVLVCDDFGGVVVAAVCEKLQREQGWRGLGLQGCELPSGYYEQSLELPGKQGLDPYRAQSFDSQHFELPCDFLADCAEMNAFVGYKAGPERLEKLATLQEKCRKYLLMFKQQANIQGYDECCVLSTGNTAPGAIKDCLIDANLLPSKSEHQKGARWPTAPPVFHLNLWRFLAQDERLLDSMGIFKDENNVFDTSQDVSPLDSASLIKELDFEYCAWLERRLTYFGVDGGLLGRIARLRCNAAGELELTPRAEYQPYYRFEGQHFQFDSLIIAAKARPLPALRALQKILNPGAPVAVFTEILPPLEELARYVIKEHRGFRFYTTKLQEVAQQVLPGRTHPAMIGPLATGYCAGFYSQGFVEPDASSVQEEKGEFLKNKREKKVR